MKTESDDQKKTADVKRQLEAIAGREIDVSADQLIKLWYPVGASSYADGNATWRSILLAGQHCYGATLLDVGGTSSTDPGGQRTFLLSDFVCPSQLFTFADPSNVVATARAAGPSFVTVMHQLVNANPPNTDLQITVHSWQPGGAAAPNVSFDWRCRVVSVPIIG